MRNGRETMLTIKVLGPGCARCIQLERTVRRVIEAKGMEAHVEKVTEMAEILRYPILSTPGLVIDEKLVSAGRIPQEKEIVNWLEHAKVRQ
jgi:small redox-active disulfide protein 2